MINYLFFIVFFTMSLTCKAGDALQKKHCLHHASASVPLLDSIHEEGDQEEKDQLLLPKALSCLNLKSLNKEGSKRLKHSSTCEDKPAKKEKDPMHSYPKSYIALSLLTGPEN